MSTAIQGTNVASAIRPFTSSDTYATAIANEIKGGHHTADSTTARNAIPAARREVGMTCRVGSVTYILITNPTTDATTDDDWSVTIASTDDINLPDGTTSLTTKLSDLATQSDTRYIVFNLSPLKAEIYDLGFVAPFACTITGAVVSLAKDTTLTKDIVLQVETNTSGSWVSVNSVTLPSTSTTNSIDSAFATANQVVIASGDRIRINVLNCQSDVDTLVVQVKVLVSST